MALTVEGCIGDLTGMGYEFYQREDGTVGAKQPARKNPRGAEMMAYLALHKEEVRAAIRARDAGMLAAPPVVGTSMSAPNAPAGEPARANVAADAPPWDDRPTTRPMMGTLAAVMPEPDAGGWVVLEGVRPEVAFAAANLINAGKAELIGQVIYRKQSDLFDLTYKLLEGMA